jgi:hypothetical protein
MKCGDSYHITRVGNTNMVRVLDYENKFCNTYEVRITVQ